MERPPLQPPGTLRPTRAVATTTTTALPNINGLDFSNSPGGGVTRGRHPLDGRAIRTDSDVKKAFIAARTSQINREQLKAAPRAAQAQTQPAGRKTTVGQRVSFFFWRCFGCGCGLDPPGSHDGRGPLPPSNVTLLGERVLFHRAWKVSTIFFTLILLFCPPFQAIWPGSGAALVFDIIFFVTLAFFVVDMAIRIIAEPDYLTFTASGRTPGVLTTDINVGSVRDLLHSERSETVGGGGGGGGGGCCGRIECFSIGSFLFWCDVVSTLALLFSISYINGVHTETAVVEVTLNELGRMVGGIGDDRRLRPVHLEIDLLIAIARTARIARFIQSRRAMELSARVNWFWIVDALGRVNPVPNFRTNWERRRQERISRLAAEYGTSRGVMDSTIEANSVDHMSVRPSLNEGGLPGSSLHQSGAMSAIGESSPHEVASRNLTQFLEKRASWGFLQQGALATIKAQQEAERLAAARAHLGSKRGIFKSIKRSLRAMGIVGDDKEAIRRHIAAMKIQRVFRKHIKENGVEGDGDGGEIENNAWIGRTATNTLERVLHKRSMMRQHAHLNRGIKVRRGINIDVLRSVRPPRDDIGGDGSQPGGSRFQSLAGDGRESQVGSDMRELTGQRVAIGIFLTLVATVIFTHLEVDTTRPAAMVMLHQQTSNNRFGGLALDAAHISSIPDLFKYEFANGTIKNFETRKNWRNNGRTEAQNVLRIAVTDANQQQTVGWFALQDELVQSAITQFVATLFILFVWFLGVSAFSGPVMTLVVIPIERMVRLLNMLMVDPLGYQDTLRFKKFQKEEDALIKNTRWTKDVLKGMETSFLMSTILRIGSLMRVGFGSAGVEIIRNNLQKGHNRSMLTLTNKGTTVSCIFLFCDIRQFTDATECLQEEVFVFTNRIAAVVHSKVHAYGGTANKNVGDAFLVSWLLDDGEHGIGHGHTFGGASSTPDLVAKHNQADKAMLSVVKICIDLYYDKYFLEPLSETAKKALCEKLKNRPGPIVQMGFGLHAGKAVQGAIGSQRKIDATYVSESVERAEFLESSTKKYGLKMLMSDNFHRLLHPTNRKKCRKVDQILLRDDDDDVDIDDYIGEDALRGDVMELFTYDMDIDALWRRPQRRNGETGDSISESGSHSERKLRRLDRRVQPSQRQMRRRRSITFRATMNIMNMNNTFNSSNINSNPSEEMTSNKSMGGAGGATEGMGNTASLFTDSPSIATMHSERGEDMPNPARQDLVLQHRPIRYTHGAWHTADMRKIRERYVQGLFFRKFNAGLQTFYKKDWYTARNCFQTILDNFEDGPSRYFMKQIEKHDGKPPKDFLGYGLA